ncbi:hypothetical protein [Capnocytophaga endodontalis]|jgi:hypothetical protein|uniref:Uncharacterized protein n=1 Tax=Capnocytophaga endodontalis TaxID=2708117 RepID=A0A1Z4BLK5_9FLAO|nr:hypothetical protein [Capnocytophaga endodontalis]ASF42174.1 hypothetical protein CBG49_03225 [Capnocytophaga endodontalis]
MSVSPKSKTFEFWSISFCEGIIVFIIFIILFHLPIFYTSELQKWWGIVIRLYLPMVVLCTLGYVKLRSRKLIIETNSKQRQFIYTRNNKQLLTEFEKVKIFYLKSSKGKIGRILRIEGTLYFIYSKNPFSKEVAKQYKSKIEELQDIIGSNTKKEKIDLVPLSINLLIDVVPFIIIPLAILYLIAIFTDNTHWFDFFKEMFS